MDALRRAEVADLGGAPGGLGSDDEDEDNEGVVGRAKGDEDEERVLRDEEAAARAARRGEAMRVGGWAEGARRDDARGGADGEEELDAEEMVAAEERERLLGEKEGKAVGSILDADRIGGAKRARVVGMEVWGVDGDEEMEMDGEEGVGVGEEWPESLLEEAGEGERPRMEEMLSAAVKRRGECRSCDPTTRLTLFFLTDAARVKFMFDAGLLRTLDLSVYPSILTWTCKLGQSFQLHASPDAPCRSRAAPQPCPPAARRSASPRSTSSATRLPLVLRRRRRSRTSSWTRSDDSACSPHYCATSPATPRQTHQTRRAADACATPTAPRSCIASSCSSRLSHGEQPVLARRDIS